MNRDGKDGVRFGTSGVRGPAGQLLDGLAAEYVSAFCRFLRSRTPDVRRICIGRDLRDSSEALSAICRGTILAAGIEVEDCGLIPTPALALYAIDGACAAVMVTGSHIAADRNGLKFYLPTGEITKPDEARISALLTAGGNNPAHFAAAVFPATGGDTLRVYIRRYTDIARSIDLSGRSFAIWAHSTVAAEPMREVLAPTGARITVFGRRNSFSPVDTEAIAPEALSEIAEFAKRKRPDAILSADADGDRPLVADGDGQIVAGDLVAFSAALALGASHIVTPVTSNSAIENQFAGRVTRTKIGSPHVLAGMRGLVAETDGCVVGFEANGGFIAGSTLHLVENAIPALPTRDALLPILALLSRFADPGIDIRGLAQEHGFRPARAMRIEGFPRDIANSLVCALADSARFRAEFAGDGAEVAVSDRIDGVCLRIGAYSRLRMHASGNAPEFRLYVEAESRQAAERLIEFAAARAKEFRDNFASPATNATGADFLIQA